ncbi:hypothetical protein SK128_028558 [Halocaridina rubra]|uniref:Epidermal growth factor receptor substrate 15 n=1 Tax=Halocaridina rubra TaxID=373956 RepID=A0AAN8WG92_HALRR
MFSITHPTVCFLESKLIIEQFACLKVANTNIASPWGDEDKLTATSQTNEDPFGSPFSAMNANIGKGGEDSPWLQDAFGSEKFGDSSVSSKGDPFSAASGEPDPFGGDYDPFKDQGFADADKFSWDDEPDPFTTLPGNKNNSSVSASENVFNNSSEKKNNDPFAFNINDDVNANVFSGGLSSTDDLSAGFNSDNKNKGGSNSRSKSVIGDPFASQVKAPIPVRSKTSLGAPIGSDFDFDPFSTSKLTPADAIMKSKSNEDLLNENFSGGIWGTNKSNAMTNRTSPFGSSSNFSEPFSKGITQGSSYNVNEDEQLAWAAQESLRFEDARKQQEEQERAELEFALALSRSIAQTGGQSQSSRSPSTGL